MPQDMALCGDGIADHVIRMVGARVEALRSIARQLGVMPPALTERDRLATIKAAATPPARCGDAIPMAPARGPMLAFAPTAVMPTADGYAVQHAGYRGRDAARVADAFDRMALQARRRGGIAPLTSAQVAIGRDYAALVERHAARGLRGISAEVRDAGGSGSGARDYMDVVVAEGLRIDALEAAIGGGVALVEQRSGSSRRGAITVRRLVDAVCLEGLTPSELLRRHGWASSAAQRSALREALGAALDRMACAPAAPGRARKGLDA